MALARHVNLLIRHYYSAKFFVNIQGIIYCGFLGVEQPLFAHAEHRESVVDVYIRIRTPCSLHCHCLRQRSYHHDTYSADKFCSFFFPLFLHPSPS